MTDGKSPATTKPAKPLLALKLSEEAEFKKKVQDVKKRPKVGFPGRVRHAGLLTVLMHVGLAEMTQTSEIAI